MAQTSPFAPIIQQWQDLANKQDAADIAKLYTSDAVAVFPEGTFQGPKAIQDDLATQFSQLDYKNVQLTDSKDNSEQANWGWSFGTWSATITPPGGSQMQVAGSWSVVWVQDGGGWKIKLHTTNTAQQ
jgi:ketosteroid isomerase-like protein